VSLRAQGGNALQPGGACAQYRTRALPVTAAVAAFFPGQRAGAPGAVALAMGLAR
jgi:hypothetical protein